MCKAVINLRHVRCVGGRDVKIKLMRKALIMVEYEERSVMFRQEGIIIIGIYDMVNMQFLKNSNCGYTPKHFL